MFGYLNSAFEARFAASAATSETDHSVNQNIYSVIDSNFIALVNNDWQISYRLLCVIPRLDGNCPHMLQQPKFDTGGATLDGRQAPNLHIRAALCNPEHATIKQDGGISV